MDENKNSLRSGGSGESGLVEHLGGRVRATGLVLVTGFIVFGLFFFNSFALRSGEDGLGLMALGAFQLLGAGVCLYLVARGNLPDASLIDWLASIVAILLGGLGFAGASITFFAVFLIFRIPQDLHTKAAGTVAAALAVQAVWAPLIFSKISFLLLQIDAGVVGWLMGLFLPGSTWAENIVSTPSGHNVEITSACASFHNLSLASLCWVTLTMLHRPYWVKSDLYVGAFAMFIQFVLNVWRLVFVCFNLPMYEFWHDGIGKHIFSAIATTSAILVVQLYLVKDEERRQRKAALVAPDIAR